MSGGDVPMGIQLRFSAVLSIVLPMMLAGCTAVTRPGPGSFEYSPSMPQPQVRDPVEANGAIYQPALAMNLVADARAGRVGDIITVLLQERTQAEKSANTDLSREATHGIGVSSGGPVGDWLEEGDRNIDLESSSEFTGEADTDQSNRLDGRIAVTVAQVLPNGNLVVQGEKWITINQGEEFIRLRGIVRPMDISDSNTVPSTRIADARITYSGRGAVADASTPSWATRFFFTALSLF
jgi:flagellar L-ring protein precursor FlgH